MNTFMWIHLQWPTPRSLKHQCYYKFPQIIPAMYCCLEPHTYTGIRSYPAGQRMAASGGPRLSWLQQGRAGWPRWLWERWAMPCLPAPSQSCPCWRGWAEAAPGSHVGPSCLSLGWPSLPVSAPGRAFQRSEGTQQLRIPATSAQTWNIPRPDWTWHVYWLGMYLVKTVKFINSNCSCQINKWRRKVYFCGWNWDEPDFLQCKTKLEIIHRHLLCWYVRDSDGV